MGGNEITPLLNFTIVLVIKIQVVNLLRRMRFLADKKYYYDLTVQRNYFFLILILYKMVSVLFFFKMFFFVFLFFFFGHRGHFRSDLV